MSLDIVFIIIFLIFVSIQLVFFSEIEDVKKNIAVIAEYLVDKMNRK